MNLQTGLLPWLPHPPSPTLSSRPHFYIFAVLFGNSRIVDLKGLSEIRKNIAAFLQKPHHGLQYHTQPMGMSGAVSVHMMLFFYCHTAPFMSSVHMVCPALLDVILANNPKYKV